MTDYKFLAEYLRFDTELRRRVSRWTAPEYECDWHFFWTFNDAVWAENGY